VIRLAHGRRWFSAVGEADSCAGAMGGVEIHGDLTHFAINC